MQICTLGTEEHLGTEEENLGTQEIQFLEFLLFGNEEATDCIIYNHEFQTAALKQVIRSS